MENVASGDHAEAQRRTSAAEFMDVTVHGEISAEPISAGDGRLASLTRAELTRILAKQADPGLREVLRELSRDTDDVRDLS